MEAGDQIKGKKNTQTKRINVRKKEEEIGIDEINVGEVKIINFSCKEEINLRTYKSYRIT